ncbi:hypothetical protein LCGC14_1500310 [marine sediment metagenome]|uniref:Uncharacterized protein n=1 Tax=marine sediment metagenome TaxID=412755 RepID=A0A0F9J4T7_9ZZZZ
MGFGVKQADLAAILADTGTTLPATLATITAKTDNLPSDPADESNITGEIQKAVSSLAFRSTADDVIDLPAVAADTALPDVVVTGIPSGVSLIRVVAVLKVRAIENTSGSGANAIKGAQAIRVKKSTGAWGTDDLAAIDLPDNLWTVAASTRESGDVLGGENDVKAEVDGNATYNLRFENALVDYASLRLNEVQVALHFDFTTG